MFAAHGVQRLSRIDSAELSRLRLAIEASGEIIFMTDANGVFTYVNPEFERVYGYSAAEVVGRTTPRLLKSGTTEGGTYRAFWGSLKDKQVVRRQFVNRNKRGQLLEVECSANPIVDDDGILIGFLAVQRDITERRRIEQALAVSEHRYRALADAAQDSIFIINRAAQIEYANGVSAARFGQTPEAVIGKRLDEILPAAIAERIWRGASAVFNSGARQLFQSHFELPTGDLWLETWLVPMASSGGVLHSVLGVGRDVTDRKMLEQQFAQAQKMEAVGRLAGGIAHDFNNLLTAILGYCDLVQDRLAEESGVAGDLAGLKADVAEIKSAGERASRLTRQLLAFSRKQPATRKVVRLSDIVNETRKLLERVVGEDVDLRFDIPADTRAIVADPGHLEQAVLNLVINSRDALPRGGRIRIMVADADLDVSFVERHPGSVAGRYVSLVVEDNGCGMSPDVLAHVFEPFFTTKAQGLGTGLGLSTVYGIVKQNNGYIAIDSEPNQGTTATIYWPMGDGASVETEPVRSVIGPSIGAETILLVEDEPGIRILMRKTLEPYGYRILEAADPKDALRICDEHDGAIDLLLSDVIMPVMNGPELAEMIVAKRRGIRVFYVSGFSKSLLPDRDREAEGIWFLAKPFTPDQLATKVRECLDQAPGARLEAPAELR